jgi:Arm DNA-binding domain
MAGKLRPLDVERETRPGKYFDGDGLYLVVKGATSRNWIYRYRKNGKERWLGLGSLKDVSLRDARMARDARGRLTSSVLTSLPILSSSLSLSSVDTGQIARGKPLAGACHRRICSLLRIP